MIPCRQITTSLSVFRLRDVLKQSVRLHGPWYSVFHVSLIMPYLKSENRIKKPVTQPSCYCFEEKYYFCLKMLTFYKKMEKPEKFRDSLHYKICFLKLPPYPYLRTKFQVSNIILPRFRQKADSPPPAFTITPPLQLQNEPLKSHPD